MKKNYLGVLILAIATLFACSQDDMQEQETGSNSTISARKANGKIPFTVEQCKKCVAYCIKILR